MEHLLVVAGVLATATFATGVMLPVLARRAVNDGDGAVDRVAAEEWSAVRPRAGLR